MRYFEENGTLVICLEGRITSDNAAETEKEITRILGEHPGKPFLFDAENLQIISSAGLRILISIHKKTPAGVQVRNVSPEVYEIFDVTGFSTFLKVKRKPRTISVEGCPVIGKGAVGEVYRLDADTIVKVYNIDNCLPMIENEQIRARQAFLKGIPTAIPFDIVKIGDKYGSVFEMIKARSCNDLVKEDNSRVDEMTDMYAAFLHQIHGALSEPGELPDAREQYLKYLDTAARDLPEDVTARIRTLIEEMPEELHIIHGDVQLKNVMFSNGEMILIDMETLSCGNTVFEMAGLYMAYVAFCEDAPNNSMEFLGIPLETDLKLFYDTFRKYLNAADEEAYQIALDKVMLLGYVRFLFVLELIGGGDAGLLALRVRHSREHLVELSARVKSLAL